MVLKNYSLTIEDAYDTTIHFLEKYWNDTQSDDASHLLSGMMLMADDRPFDRAMWSDWFDALGKVKPSEDVDLETTHLTTEQAYFTMVAFLEIYCVLGAEDDFIVFVSSLKTKTSEAVTWQDWLDSVKEITSHTPRVRPYAQLLPK